MKKKRKKLKIPRRREPETIGLDFILYVVVLWILNMLNSVNALLLQHGIWFDVRGHFDQRILENIKVMILV